MARLAFDCFRALGDFSMLVQVGLLREVLITNQTIHGILSIIRLIFKSFAPD
jgi:ABC-type uncharacterized transport system ATPase subunit